MKENNEFIFANKRYGFPPVTTEIRVARLVFDEPTLWQKFVNWIKTLFKRKQYDR